jgi:hypothetical protein
LEKKVKERRGAMTQFIKAQIETISIIKKDPIKARAALKNYFRSSDDELARCPPACESENHMNCYRKYV